MTGKPKRGLADFLSREFKTSREPEAPEAPEAPESRGPEPAKSQTPEVPKSRSPEAPKPRVPEAPAAAEEPLYLRLTRKEVRFRDAQLEALHATARRLSRARRGAGARAERITENTLVRVAVDLLLAHGDELAGHDEPALLESLRRLSRKKA